MTKTNWDGIPVKGPSQLGKITGIGVLIVVIGVVVLILAFSSTVYIGGDEVGIVEKKFLGKSLPPGKVIATEGENGIQADMLPPGWHFWKFPWMYKISKERFIEIKEGNVGLITTMDGKPLEEDMIYAPKWTDEQRMRDAKYFLTEGGGYKGPQMTVLTPGKYPMNTRLYRITEAPVTNVLAGQVAVVKSNVGERVQVESRLVPVNARGIWEKPLTEGMYYLNTKAYEITPISIRQVKVSYTAEMEKGERASQEMRPIQVLSKDGYAFPVDVRITYQIESQNAPKVVAMIGDDDLVLDKLVSPRVRTVFRNNAEKVKALDFVQKRSEIGDQSLVMLKEDLGDYGVTMLEVSIGNVGDEKSLGALLKTQTDREIAVQEQVTFEEQQRAAEKQKALERTRQEAEEEKRLATAMYAVKVADEEKKQLIIQAEAEAEQIRLVAEAKAKAYQMVAEVIGSSNAALLEIMKLVADSDIRITPDVMVSGGAGSGMTDAMMGTMLKGMLEQQKTQQ